MDEHVSTSVEYALRRDAGRINSVLIRIFGVEQIDAIEDAVQEALIKALRVWSIKGIPENQTAWLIQVAKNHLYDQFRKQNRLTSLDEEFRSVERAVSLTGDQFFFENEISEDQLRMIFACCHPSIPKDSQIALTLKTVGGFNNREIASAFLAKRPTIDKMLVRAKSRLKTQRESFVIPDPEKLKIRLESVLKVVYLMFNEGYMALEGDRLIRSELCIEAIRLVRLLADNRLTSSPKTMALAALLHFQGSRLSARTGDDGFPALLSEQNRGEWDFEMIRDGLQFMRASAGGDELSSYHLEMEIASEHVLASSYEATDWHSILRSYEALYHINSSPVVGLNMVFALGKVHGAEAGLIAMSQLDEAELKNYYPYHMTIAEFSKQTGNHKAALKAYKIAFGMTSNESVKKFIGNKLASVTR
jgi:RNA polymerase sigma-70 factor (ECF subfamily)